jgi:hypothetical protein
MLYRPSPTSFTKLPRPREIDDALAELVQGLRAKYPGNSTVIPQRVARRAMAVAGVPTRTINRAMRQAAHQRRTGVGRISIRSTSSDPVLDRLVGLIGIDALWRAVDRATAPTD